MRQAIPLVLIAAAMSSALMIPQSAAQTKVFVPLTANDGLLITSSAAVTVERVPIQQIGDTPVVPITPTPPVPSVSLADAVKAATAAVPNYDGKDRDQRAVAFTLSFLAQAIPDNEANSAKFSEALKPAFDSALGANASKWSSWWSAVTSRTSSLTNSQLKAAIPDIANALVADLPASSEASESIQGMSGPIGTQGLSPDAVAKLMQVLLPLLLQLLKSLFTH